jgi:uncharacterized protein YxjI
LEDDGGKNFEIKGKIFETHDHFSTAQTSGVKTIQATQPIANSRIVETTVKEDRNGSCSTITFGGGLHCVRQSDDL